MLVKILIMWRAIQFKSCKIFCPFDLKMLAKFTQTVDTDSEHTASASRESEHTIEVATKHTSQLAFEPSYVPPSMIPNYHRTLIHPISEKVQAIKSFKAAPQYLKDVWFNEFKKNYRWDQLEENIEHCIFEKRGAKLLIDHLREVCVGLADENKTKPHWIANDVLDDLVCIWESEDFKKLSEKNKSNRNSNSGGLGASLHSYGSISMIEHCRRLRGGYAYVFGSDTQHYFLEDSEKSKSQARASSSNAILMAETQEMREENKFIREKLKKMGAIFAQLNANLEFLSSLNLNNNSKSLNDETQAHSDED
nr:putative transposase En/Spm [Ipomoea batatas]